jgi:hypothetical protein
MRERTWVILLDVRQRALTQLYARLPPVDLSHVLAQCAGAECRVITSRSCGWSNLASPQRTVPVQDSEVIDITMYGRSKIGVELRLGAEELKAVPERG